MRPESVFRIARNWSLIEKMAIRSQFSYITSSSNSVDVVLFPLSTLVTVPSFMPISLIVPVLWQFPFIVDWPEIRKSEIHPYGFSSISGDWSKLGILQRSELYIKSLQKVIERSFSTNFLTTQVSPLLRNFLRHQTRISILT